MAIVALMTGGLGTWLLTQAVSQYRVSDRIQNEVDVATAMLSVPEQLMAERVATVNALLDDDPAADALLAAIGQIRRQTDAAITHAEQIVSPLRYAGVAEQVAILRHVRDDLMSWRDRADVMLSRAEAGRDSGFLVAFITSTTVSVAALDHALDIGDEGAAQHDGTTMDLVELARRGWRVRILVASQNGVVIATMKGRAPIDAVWLERLINNDGALTENWKAIDSVIQRLADMPELRPVVEQAHAAFAASDETYREVREASRHGGPYPLGPREFGDQSVRAAKAELTVRDTALRFARTRTAADRQAALITVAAVGCSLLLIMTVLGTVLWLMSRRIVIPLLVMTDVIGRLARRDYSQETPGRRRSDEVGRIANAVEALRLAAIAAEQAVAERTAALVASETRLADAIESLPQACVVFDANDCLVVCNTAYREGLGRDGDYARPGISYEDLMRKVFGSALAAIEGIDAEAWLQARFAQHRAVGIQAVRSEQRHFDGRWLDRQECRTRDGGLVTLLVDVSESHRQMAKLAEQDKLAALGRVAGGVAHEINNLLQPALIFADLVCDRLPADDLESREYLSLVLDSARKARQIVRDVLLFARKEDAELEALDLAQEVAAALKLVRALLPVGVALTQDLGPGGLSAAVNRTQLTQILTNLVVNAVHATGAQGTIKVALGQVLPDDNTADTLGIVPGAEYLTLSVTDQGNGMDTATMARIFEPFFTTKPVGVGTGLGLSVVFGILRSWKGAIAVNSEVGRGTMFTLYLRKQNQHSFARLPERA